MTQISRITVSLEFMLGHEFWELHEAAFNLTSWPENIIVTGTHVFIREKLNRGALYLVGERLNKKKLNVDTLNILSALKQSIEMGELNAWPSKISLQHLYGKHMSCFVRSWEVINWALMNGFILSKELQNLIGIHQFKSHSRKSVHAQVQNQTVGQYLLLDNPKFVVTELIKHPWMMRFGILNANPKQYEYKSIRLALNKLFDSQGKRGRPLPVELREEPRKYNLKPIPEVMRTSEEGTPHFCIPHFRTVIITAMKINMEKIGRSRLFTMTEPEFMLELMQDKIIRLYLVSASTNIMKIALECCYVELSNMLYAHPKMAFIPVEQRQYMPISKLWESNKELCLEGFTKEERLIMEIAP